MTDPPAPIHPVPGVISVSDEGGPCQHWLDHRKENTT
jgi:hypothetical protein